MNQNNTPDGAFHLPANQVRVLNSLLRTTSIEKASEDSGLSTATIKRYLADDTFAAVYRQQRMIVLASTVAGLTSLGSEAVEKIKDAMSSGDPNTELRAACRVLDYITRLVELERRIRDQDEIEERLRRLEEADSENGSSSGAGVGHLWGVQ